MTLDQEIAAVSQLLSLLLAFLTGYFSALFPIIEQLLLQSAPDVQADRRKLVARLSAYRKLVAAFAILVFLALSLLMPLSGQVVIAIAPRASFNTLRAGLLLLDVFMIVMGVVSLSLSLRLRRRIRELG